MYGRPVGPLWVDEFTAGYLQDILSDELESLKEQLDERRDKADRLGWGHMKVRISGLHGLWQEVRSLRDTVGDPLPEDVQDLERDAVRWARDMPRSSANEVVWRRQKAEEREERERVLKAREGARRGRSRT